MKCIVRKAYAYYWLGQDRFGGAVVDIPEEEYKKKAWIFEPPEYAAKVLAEPESAKQEEVVEEQPEPEVQQEVVEEGIINNRAIVTPKSVRRKK